MQFSRPRALPAEADEPAFSKSFGLFPKRAATFTEPYTDDGLRGFPDTRTGPHAWYEPPPLVSFVLSDPDTIEAVTFPRSLLAHAIRSGL